MRFLTIAFALLLTNCVAIDADFVGGLTLVGPGAGERATASAVSLDATGAWGALRGADEFGFSTAPLVVFVGGVVPQQDYDFLYAAGVKGIYGPGTPIPASAKDVLEQIRASLKK